MTEPEAEADLELFIAETAEQAPSAGILKYFDCPLALDSSAAHATGIHSKGILFNLPFFLSYKQQFFAQPFFNCVMSGSP